MIKTTLCLLAVFVLAGCVSQPIKPVDGTLEVADDGFGRTVSVTSVRYNHAWQNGGALSYFLLSAIDRQTGAITRSIVFRDTYNRNGWKFWQYAATQRGDNLQVVVQNRKVNGCDRTGCNYTELFVAMIQDDFLKVASGGDISIKIGSQAAGSHVVTIPGHDIAAFADLERATSNRMMRK